MKGKPRGKPFTGADDPRRSTGAYPGHAPTNTIGTLAKYAREHPEHSFAGAGIKNRIVGQPKSKERKCLEEIQNGAEESDLEGRYPPRMITRLIELMKVAENAEHVAWRYAFLEVRDILGSRKGSAAEGDGPNPTGGVSVTINHTQPKPIPLPGGEAPE